MGFGHWNLSRLQEELRQGFRHRFRKRFEDWDLGKGLGPEMSVWCSDSRIWNLDTRIPEVFRERFGKGFSHCFGHHFW